MPKLTTAQQNVVTALNSGVSICRVWPGASFRRNDTFKVVAESTLSALSQLKLIEYSHIGDYTYVGFAAEPEPATVPEPEFQPGEPVIVLTDDGVRAGVVKAVTGYDAQRGHGYDIHFYEVQDIEPISPPDLSIVSTPRPINISAYDYECRPGLHRAAKKGAIVVKTLTGMSITRARVVGRNVEVLERGGCWHVIGSNDTLIVAGRV